MAAEACIEELREQPRSRRVKALRKLIRRLGQAPVAEEDLAQGRQASGSLRALADLAAEAERLHAVAEASYLQAYEGGIVRLRQILLRDRVMEAIAWQSLSAVEAVAHFIGTDETGQDDRRVRRTALLATNYLQRLCVKNDTVGFFGPTAWGSFDDDVPAIDSQPGPELVDRYCYVFETWALNAAFESLADEAKPYLPVWRMPSLALDGSTVKLPMAAPVDRGPAVAFALVEADGTRTSVELGEELVRRGLVADIPAAEELLDELEQEGLLSRTAHVPRMYGSERELRRWLEAMPTDLARPHLERLDRIEAARDRVEEARGDVAALRKALEHMSSLFEELAGRGSRGGGGFYEARYPLFHEGFREASTLRIGPSLRDELGRCFAPVLLATRWYLNRYAQRIEDAARELLERSGGQRMEMLAAFMSLTPLFEKLAEEVAEETQRRWDEAIRPLVEDGHVDVAAAQRAIGEAFPHEPLRYDRGRHSSPDVMIAAKDVDAIRRGEYRFVLGEIHVAQNTLRQLGHSWMDDRGEEIASWIREDLRGRPLHCDFSFRDVLVRGARPPGLHTGPLIIPHLLNRQWKNDDVQPLAATYLERNGDRMQVRCELTGNVVDVVDAFNPMTQLPIRNAFRLHPSNERHTPRLSFGKLVVQRERWVVSPDELAFLRSHDRFQRFDALRTWRDSEGIPRFVFVKVKTETKPVFYDLDSPLFVEALVKLVRGLDDEPVAISEMLPGPEDLWLTDAEGRTYTAELRFVAVDESSPV